MDCPTAVSAQLAPVITPHIISPAPDPSGRWFEFLELWRFDFSTAAVHLVASVPGMHSPVPFMASDAYVPIVEESKDSTLAVSQQGGKLTLCMPYVWAELAHLPCLHIITDSSHFGVLGGLRVPIIGRPIAMQQMRHFEASSMIGHQLILTLTSWRLL